ncbi:MAG: M3 family metallopeptidase [Alloprevotella sp.]|nr:M3 family metallopeptidase [Alloprevotella sp.]
MSSHSNPFFSPFQTPHSSIPFGSISLQDIREALEEGMKREKDEIEKIISNPESPTFENTVVPFANSGSLLEVACTVMYNLSSAETTDELDELTMTMAPVLAQHSSDIMLNERLYERIKHVYQTASLDTDEDKMLLDKTYEAFERSGATLDDKGKKRFREISSELSVLTTQFSQNHLHDTNSFQLHLTEREQVDGLPESQLKQASKEASDRGLQGWVITLKAPSYVPFMTYADNRALREQLYRAYNTQCIHGDAADNTENVRKIVSLRLELAQLLGYKTYAEYALKRRMAEKPENVYSLLQQLLASYKHPAEAEVNEVLQFAKQSEGEDFVLQPWDFAYWSHKLKLANYNLDAEMLRPYLELSAVRRGIFELATKLYGITFRRSQDIPVYHPDVEAFEVLDKDGSYLAILYLDFHPRKGKQSGAWMTSYKEQWTESDGTDSRPHVSVVMNLTKPTADHPALLTLGEVSTFLHEFGHALHGIFARTKYKALSGTNVYWDFVELPSQIMENFADEPEFLKSFARHYVSGELIPEELIERVRRAKTFQAAYSCVRQLSFGLLDMAYYDRVEPLRDDIREFERRAWSSTQLLPYLPEACMSVQFGHIMSGGYAAGYYSYKWAEVLDADAFSLFRENGIFDPVTAQRFRDCILSQGGTKHPMQLYQSFRGRKPSIEALLKRDGIRS